MQSAPVTTPSTSSKWEQLVARMPRPDPEEKILKNVQEGQVEQVVAELQAGGREALVGLVDLLREPGDGPSDSPVRHALHALVVHAGGLGEEPRRAIAAALASTLSGRERSAGARKFVVQELRWCGGAEVAPALGELLRDEQLYSDAAMALLAVGGAAAAGQFRAALADLAGPQRVAAIVALGVLKDRESDAELHRAADRDPDPVARMEAVRALARIASPVSMALLLQFADEARGFDRVRATDACLLLAENYAAGGHRDAAAMVYRHLRDTRNDPSEAYVRDLARKALGE